MKQFYLKTTKQQHFANKIGVMREKDTKNTVKLCHLF